MLKKVKIPRHTIHITTIYIQDTDTEILITIPEY
jgi:hypothetical protein